ncbi:MAG: hypothetical protein ACI9WU_005407, partial [Myxococcota bacterium]
GEVCRQLEQRDIEAHLIPEVPDMVRWLVDRVRPGDVVLGMSGRHFYDLHALVLQSLHRSGSDQLSR